MHLTVDLRQHVFGKYNTHAYMTIWVMRATKKNTKRAKTCYLWLAACTRVFSIKLARCQKGYKDQAGFFGKASRRLYYVVL